MNLHSFLLIFFVIFFSHHVERIGKRKVLYTLYFIQFFSLVLMAIFIKNIYILFVLKIFGSLSYAAGFTIHSSVVFEILPKNKRVSGIALFGISGIISNPVGGFLSELVYKNLPPAYIFVLASIFCLGALIMAIVIPFPEKKEKDSHIPFWKIFSRRSLLPLLVMAIYLGGAWSVNATFIPAFTGERFNEANISFYALAFAVVAISFRFFFSSIMDNLSKRLLVVVAFCLILSGEIFILFTSAVWQMVGVGFLYGLGHAILYPVLNTIFVNSGRENEKYTLNSIFISFYTMGNFLISGALGYAGDLFGIAFIYIFMAILASTGILIGLRMDRRIVG